MAHHHLLPLILALILVILPSSSHAEEETSALFSDRNVFLIGGNNLTHGIYTLSLGVNCSLRYYVNGELNQDYNTTINDADGCLLFIDHHGRLLFQTGDGQNRTRLGVAYEFGEYALLFTKKGLGIYGPRIWNNKIHHDELQTLKNRNLRATTSSNVIYSPDTITSTAANGDTLLATNNDASVYITQYCALSVNHTTTGENIWNSNNTIAKPGDCSLYLTNEGVLLLVQYEQKSNELITHWTGGAFAEVNDLYVLVVRFYGAIDIYGFKINVVDIPAHDGSVPEKIKMVTTAA